VEHATKKLSTREHTFVPLLTRGIGHVKKNQEKAEALMMGEGGRSCWFSGGLNKGSLI